MPKSHIVHECIAGGWLVYVDSSRLNLREAKNAKVRLGSYPADGDSIAQLGDLPVDRCNNATPAKG